MKDPNFLINPFAQCKDWREFEAERLKYRRGAPKDKSCPRTGLASR
jgi:hypothetical protein